MVTETFKKKIKYYLIDHDMSQAELAHKINTTPGMLCMVLKGKRTSKVVEDRLKEVIKKK